LDLTAEIHRGVYVGQTLVKMLVLSYDRELHRWCLFSKRTRLLIRVAIFYNAGVATHDRRIGSWFIITIQVSEIHSSLERA
jgi:hypothetical protein